MNWVSGTLVITHDTGKEEVINEITYANAVEYVKTLGPYLESAFYHPNTVQIEV